MTPMGSTISSSQLILDRLGTIQVMQIVGLTITLLTAIFAFSLMVSCFKILGISLSIERFIKAWRTGKDNDQIKKPRTRKEIQDDLIKEWERQGGKLK